MSGNGIVHASYVLMNGKLGFIKQRRYLVLDESLNALCICKSEKDVSQRRALPLMGLERTELHGTKFFIKYSGAASPPNSGRSFTFWCRTEEEAADWVSAIVSSLEELKHKQLESTHPPSHQKPRSSLSRRKSSQRASKAIEDIEHEMGEEQEEVEEEKEKEEKVIDLRRPSSHRKSAATTASGSGASYVADLEFFELLGGIVVSETDLVWIGERKPKANPRQLGSSMFFSRFSTSSTKSRTPSTKSRTPSTKSRTPSTSSTRKHSSSHRSSSKLSPPNRKSSAQPPSHQSETPPPTTSIPKPRQRPVTMRIPEGFDKVIEQNVMDKSKGKGPSNKKAVRPPANLVAKPPPSPTKSKGFRFFGKKAKGKAPSEPEPELAPHKELSKEELKEKIARQARLAGGGEYITGAATVGLGEEIQKSKLAQTLAQRKAELEKKKEAERKQEQAAKAQVKPKKKHTLDSFLKEAETESANSKPKNKLQEFLEGEDKI